MKRWAVIVTAVGLLLLFAACGGSSDSAVDGVKGVWDSMVWDRDNWQ